MTPRLQSTCRQMSLKGTPCPCMKAVRGAAASPRRRQLPGRVILLSRARGLTGVPCSLRTTQFEGRLSLGRPWNPPRTPADGANAGQGGLCCNQTLRRGTVSSNTAYKYEHNILVFDKHIKSGH